MDMTKDPSFIGAVWSVQAARSSEICRVFRPFLSSSVKLDGQSFLSDVSLWSHRFWCQLALIALLRSIFGSWGHSTIESSQSRICLKDRNIFSAPDTNCCSPLKKTLKLHWMLNSIFPNNDGLVYKAWLFWQCCFNWIWIGFYIAKSVNLPLMFYFKTDHVSQYLTHRHKLPSLCQRKASSTLYNDFKLSCLQFVMSLQTKHWDDNESRKPGLYMCVWVG